MLPSDRALREYVTMIHRDLAVSWEHEVSVVFFYENLNTEEVKLKHS